MPRFLLDANVLSEMVKPRPDPGVIAWLRAAPPQEVATSIMVVGEILQGILAIEARSAHRAAALRSWLGEIEATHLVLPVDERVIGEWAGLRVAMPMEQGFEDMLIAATALAHRMTVVTRNVGDFASLGVETLNPWTGN